MDERIVLPPKYYHTNFEYLLSFVKDKYHELLNVSEWSFLRQYYCLSEDAQCLFIRFCNRKGLFFKTNGLAYEELENTENLLLQLYKIGFVSKINFEEHKLFFLEIVQVLTKQELIKVFDLNSLKSEKREILVNFLIEKFSVEEIFEKIESEVKLIKVNFELHVSFMKFLFFGNRAMDMTEFVLRDMGLIQYYKHKDDDLVARFETRKDAEDKWMISDQYEIFETLKNQVSVAEIKNWFLNLNLNVPSLSKVAFPSFEKLALRIGKYFEQNKGYEEAIEIYQTIESTPSRERTARCFLKTGNIEEAKVLCSEMILSPFNIDEQYFAEYFLKTLKGKKSKKQTTEWLQSSEAIEIDKMYKNQVELGAIQYYLDLGFEAGFSENFTWRTLFGLWFWDIIFDPSLVAFHHPFQRRPSDLHLPDFYFKRKGQLEQQLAAFQDSSELLAHLWETFVKNQGTANPFVVWIEEIWEMVRVIVIKIDLDKLKQIVMKIAENIVENSRGLPDLLVWSENHYELVEIKSPSDNLSHQQLFWFRFFKENEINAKVLRVTFSM